MSKYLKIIPFFCLLFFYVQAKADAICKDGWKSTSEGSGTCSWHGGVCKWVPNYTHNSNSNNYNSSHNHGYNNCSYGGGGVSDQAVLAAAIAALFLTDAAEVNKINLNQYKSSDYWDQSNFIENLKSFNKHLSYNERKMVFEYMDVNRDKKVTVYEFRAADKNKDNTLTTTELEWYRKANYKGTIF